MLNLLWDSVSWELEKEKWEEEDEEGGGGSGWSHQLNISSGNVTVQVIFLWEL